MVRTSALNRLKVNLLIKYILLNIYDTVSIKTYLDMFVLCYKWNELNSRQHSLSIPPPKRDTEGNINLKWVK